MPSSNECYFTCSYLPCSARPRVAYDCSMAKKRRAEEQALGVPVNKRKSLLMKPRHYSPDMDCKENPDNRNEDDGLETNDHSTAGSKRHGPSFIYSCHQTSFLVHEEDTVHIAVKLYLGFGNKNPTIVSVNVHLLRLHLF